MKDYSQYGEQHAILAAFGTQGSSGQGLKLDGRFLDIGAYHPTDKSNTRALFELGWSGIMIEPAPGPMRSLLTEYGNEPRITLIQAAVVHEAALVALHVSEDAVSTTDGAQFEKWKESAAFTGLMLVPGITLPQISNQFGGFDFINIDAEGTSVDLFLEALKLGWEPRCFCVEHDDRLAELLTAATGKSYVATATNACNVVLVKK
jgi:FkbM family methyltransferase